MRVHRFRFKIFWELDLWRWGSRRVAGSTVGEEGLQLVCLLLFDHLWHPRPDLLSACLSKCAQFRLLVSSIQWVPLVLDLDTQIQLECQIERRALLQSSWTQQGRDEHPIKRDGWMEPLVRRKSQSFPCPLFDKEMWLNFHVLSRPKKGVPETTVRP